MAFNPASGYSEDRTSTVFTDGTNNQRGEFSFLLDASWTPVSYDENRSSILVQNGDLKQRATVVYNIGNSSSGTATTSTNITTDSSLSGNGTTNSPLKIADSVMTSISTNADNIATLQTDIGDLGDIVNTNSNTIQSLQTNKQNTLTPAQLEAVNSGITSDKLNTLDADISELGNQVQGIQGNLNAGTPTFSLPVETTDPTIISYANKFVMISGVTTIGSVGAGTSSTTPVTLPSSIVMADTNYNILLTSTSNDEFCDILAEYKNKTTNGFTIAYKNVDENSASEVKVSWLVIGLKQ